MTLSNSIQLYQEGNRSNVEQVTDRAKSGVEASKREIEGGGEKDGGIYIQREHCARGRSRNIRVQGRNRTRVYVQAGKPGCTVL